MRRLSVSVLLLLTLTCVSAPAAISSPPDGEAALLDQYVEDLPTATGGTVGGGHGGGTGANTGSQPPPLSSPLEGQLLLAVPADEAAALKRIATSPGYGAPTMSLEGPGADDETELLSPSTFSSFRSAISAVADRGGGRGLPLLPMLLVTILGVGAAALFRHKPRQTN